MATFHQNLVQSFLNFKNKYMRSYDTWADAQSDIANIPEGGRFFTKDGGSNVPINARNVRYDDGTQAGSDVETQISEIKSDLSDIDSGVLITFTVPNTSGATKLQNYPTGYTMDNAIVTYPLVKNPGGTEYAFEPVASAFNISLMSDGIYCYVPSGSTFMGRDAKIMLFKG